MKGWSSFQNYIFAASKKTWNKMLSSKIISCPFLDFSAHVIYSILSMLIKDFFKKVAREVFTL